MLNSIFFVCLVLFSAIAQAQLEFGPPVPLAPNINNVQDFTVWHHEGGHRIILGGSNGDHLALDLLGGSIIGMHRLIQNEERTTFDHVADLDGDGYPDIIRQFPASQEQPALLSIHRGRTDGSMASPILIPMDATYSSALSADLTGDGRLELLLYRQGQMDIFRWDHVNGGLSLLRTLNSGSVRTTSDINGDGIMDVAYVSGAYLYWWSPVSGSTSSPVIIGTMDGFAPDALKASDITGNGVVDLFAIGPSGSGYRIWEGMGQGVFQPHPPMSLFPGLQAPLLQAAGGGHAALFGSSNGLILRRYFNSDLSLAPPDTIMYWVVKALDMKHTDVNGDGLDDLLIVTQDARLLLAAASTGEGLPPVTTLYQWTIPRATAVTAMAADELGREFPCFITSIFGEAWVMTLRPDRQYLQPDRFHIGRYIYESQPLDHLGRFDVDGDGDQDLFGYVDHASSFDLRHIFFLEDLGNHALQMHPLGIHFVYSGPYVRYRIHSHSWFDVNNDGHNDLILYGTWHQLSNWPGSESDNRLLINTGPFSFEEGTSPIPLNEFQHHHDMNGDGLADLLVRSAGGAITIKQNNGDGTFTPVSQAAGVLPEFWIGWYDMDGDGRQELVYQENAGMAASLKIRRVLDNSFSEPELLLEITGHARHMADLTGNGLPDVILTRVENDMMRISVSRNDGVFPLSAPELLMEIPTARVHFMDVDGDGSTDMVLNRQGSWYFLRNLTAMATESDPPGMLLVFPNPAQGNITFLLPSHPQMRLEIFDTMGRLLIQRPATSGANTVAVDMLPDGTYFLRILSAGDNSPIGGTRFQVVR